MHTHSKWMKCVSRKFLPFFLSFFLFFLSFFLFSPTFLLKLKRGHASSHKVSSLSLCSFFLSFFLLYLVVSVCWATISQSLLQSLSLSLSHFQTHTFATSSRWGDANSLFSIFLNFFCRRNQANWYCWTCAAACGNRKGPWLPPCWDSFR